MDRKSWIFFVILIVVPCISILYKLNIANLSLLPVSVEDTYNIQVSILPKENVAFSEINFPFPKQNSQVKILKYDIQSSGMDFEIKKKNIGHLVHWEGDEWQGTIGYYVKLQLLPYENEPPKSDTNQVISPKRKIYTETKFFSNSEIQAGKKILESIHPYDKDKVNASRQIFYYIAEEIANTSKDLTLEESILLNSGNSLNKALLFSLICRLRDIPVRTVLGFDLKRAAEKTKDNKFKFTYWNEIFLDGRWHFVSTSRNRFLSKEKDFLPIWKSMEDHRNLGQESPVFKYTAYITNANVNRYNFKEYSEEVTSKNNFLQYYSLYSLPTALQNLFRIIILIPIGALVLSIARNLIGIPTFGIFTPILLSMFFYETNLIFGISFFLFMIGLGFFERYALDKFYLLAVPRLSILLTITVLTLIVFSILNESVGLFGNLSVTLFPIVITTIFVERFSIMIIEEGILNTFITLGGTLFIALISYMLFFFGSLQILFFTHPELLLIIIAFQILIGQYKGYRLTELFRFREIFR